jgi:hypothetical protein
MRKKKNKSFLTMVLIALIVLSLASIVYVILFHHEDPVAVRERPVKKIQTERGKDKPVSVKDTREKAKAKEAHDAPPAMARPSGKEKTVMAKITPRTLPSRQMAIIIDDIGYDMSALRELLKIDAEITYAVLPLLSHSREAAEALHQANREILLHLPMEPSSYPKEKPGSGALFTEMNDEEIIFQLEKNLTSVPFAVGVNNHMGSKFMADEEKLTTVFRQLKKRNLFFIDSRTTGDSKASAASRKVHLTVASRRVFLDNERDYHKIYRILMNAAEAPSDNAPVIVIGHPYPETIRALRDASRDLKEKGVSIIPASQLIKRTSAEGSS